MGRMFIAVVPEGPAENNEIMQLMGKLRRTTSERTKEVRWTPSELWHVTVQFLGEVGSQGARLREVFADLPMPQTKLILRLHGFGAFPTPEEARVLWMGVQENQAFLQYQQDISSMLESNGFALGERDFKPHLTLARFRNVTSVSDLLRLGGRKHFGDYPVKELILFESVLQGNIVKYVPILRRAIPF